MSKTIDMKKYSDEEIKSFVSKAQFKDKPREGGNNALPGITVVTPSFNQGQFLERAILSVLNQNYPNLEYIIIDGGSKDGSVEVIKKYEKHLAYWVSEPDKGQSDAHNKGFARATGEIFFCLPSDDILLPGMLHKAAKIFKENDVDVLYGNRLIIDPNDKIISERRCVHYIPGITKKGILSNAGFAFYLDSAFYKREIFEKVGGFDLNLHNTLDTDLMFKFMESTKRIRFLREYVIAFRVTPDAKTVSMWDTRRQAETDRLFSKYGRYKLTKCYKLPLTLLYLFMFILQGDLSYILFRVFKEKRKKYHEYFS